MSTVVHVKGISAQTPEKEVRDFFSFCGKIANLELKPEGESQSATVTFEKETAAKTALLLDNTQLGPSQVHVTSTSSTGTTSTGTTKEAAHESENDVAQEDKPRSRIFAEYLAHGYVISDKVIERGLALDQQHGISNRFTSALKNFDDKYKATDKTRNLDQQYGVTARANTAWSGLNSYFEKATSTPTGQKLRDFYVQTSKQVLDVHNEARHLANLKTGGPTAPAAGASGTTESKVSIEEAEMEKVGDSDRTKCNCGASTEKCPCAPGKCACNNCAKNEDVKV
jgi:hypothetical protein